MNLANVSFEESNGQSRFNYLLTGINKQRIRRTEVGIIHRLPLVRQDRPIALRHAVSLRLLLVEELVKHCLQFRL
jgi:hypothetical protein